MKKALVVAVLGAFAVFAVGATTVQADAKKIDWPEAAFGKAKTKSVPSFNHEKHGKDFGCVTCHHTQPKLGTDPAEKAKSCITDGCHGAAGDEKKPTAKDIIHKDTGKCLKCHKTDEKAKAAGAPTKCDACHPKA